MLKIAVCDDESEQAQLFRLYADNYFKKRGAEASVCVFDSADELLAASARGSFDVALLDICMPETQGLEAARELRRRGERTEVIFLTSSRSFAIEAFALKAAHYLLKPVSQECFDGAMDTALERLSAQKTSVLLLKLAGGRLRTARPDDILYVESCAHSQTVRFTDGSEAEARESLSWFAAEFAKIAPGQFVSPYKGYLVNLRAVHSIRAETLVLRGGQSLPIAKGCFRELKDAYFDFMLNGGTAPR